MSKTEDYYNSISDNLISELSECYYNGSLIIDDINSDPSSFIEQDVNNVINLSKLGNNVLELGCGTGYFFKRLIEKKPTINYRGIDISEQQIKNCKIVNSKHQDLFSVVNWENGLPFEDENTDSSMIYSSENPAFFLAPMSKIIPFALAGVKGNSSELQKDCQSVLD